MEILLNIRLNLQAPLIIVLSDINLAQKVKDLKVTAAEKVNLSVNSFELIHSGCILKEELTMEVCGLKNGSMVHVLKKPDSEGTSQEKRNLSKAETRNLNKRSVTIAKKNLAFLFKTVNENSALRSALHRLVKKQEIIEKIIASTPELKNDAVAVAILQDPDLMLHFTDANIINKITKMHPALYQPALLIATSVHGEAHNAASGSGSTSNGHSSGFQYSLENMSDDDEMTGDSSQSANSNQGGFSGNSNSLITTAQLASALSHARDFPLATSPMSIPGEVGGPGGIITAEMFTHAMLQAFAANPQSANATLVPPPPPTPPSADMQVHISLMREMGLQNEAINIQALQFTNGDVQAAVELILSGFGEN